MDDGRHVFLKLCTLRLHQHFAAERSVQRDFCENKKSAAADWAAYVLGFPDDDGLLNHEKRLADCESFCLMKTISVKPSYYSQIFQKPLHMLSLQLSKNMIQ